MARRRRKILRVVGWILVGFISFILLITLAFYLGRGLIMKRALDYLNDHQPGEVQMGQINLIPLMDFPDVVLQIRNLNYYEKTVSPDSLYQEPILYMSELYLSLDVVDLIRGNLKVSHARLRDGFVRFEVYEDSVSNLEYALGIRFGEEKQEDTLQDRSGMLIDMDRIELTNILALYRDRTSNDRVSLMINRLESQFSYLPEIIEAGVELNVDINEIKYLTYSLEEKSGVKFTSRISIDQVGKKVEINPSILEISGLELETWGTYDFLAEPSVNLAFRATNTGLDVLNFLLLGILDMDEIEQIGSGSIQLDGSIIGSLENGFPVIRVNGTAQRIGFRIKSVKRDVTDISFNLFATNGSKADLSEGQLEVKGFRASFPEGSLRGNIRAVNMVRPEIDLALKGEVELTGLEQMIQLEKLRDLNGRVSLDVDLKGVLDRKSEEFLNDAGVVTAKAENVGFIWNSDTVSGLNGEVFMEGNMMGTRDLGLVYNGNHAEVKVMVKDALYYMLDFERGVDASISLASDVIYPGTIFPDTAITGYIGEEIRGLHFNLGVSISKQELDAFFNDSTIPRMQLTLDSFGIRLPVYAEISNLSASLTLGPDTLLLNDLNGTIGESSIRLSGRVDHFGSLFKQDSAAVIGVGYSLASKRMRAEDFLSYKDGFLLPETYRTEYLEDFHLSGSIQIPLAGLLNDSTDLDFALKIEDMGWNLRYYPLAFENFNLQVRKVGNELDIEEFEGKVGEYRLKMSGMLGNYKDSLWQNLYGHMELQSDLLDFNDLLNYQLPEELKPKSVSDTPVVHEPLRLDQIDYPDFDFSIDVGKIRFGSNMALGIKGRLRSSTAKIFHMENLVISSESGGTVKLNGQFSVASPSFYIFSTKLEMKDVNIKDLDFEMKSGEEVYTLKENFAGLVSGTGLAEVFMSPDFKPDMTTTTAMFQMQISDGSLINFTPLKAAGKFLDNKDLNHVHFSTLRNSFTLMDSKIIVPLMIVESTIGQMLIEGEQGLDNSYIYLLRLPTWLVKDAAKSRLTGARDDGLEDEIQKMQLGKFMRMTLWSDGIESEVKLGDKREKFH